MGDYRSTFFLSTHNDGTSNRDERDEHAVKSGFLKTPKEQKRKSKRTSAGAQIAQFVAFYGYAAYWNEMYETTDHIIPYKLFQLRYREMWHGLAAERINMAKAIRVGYGWATIPDKPGFKKEFKLEQDQAEGH